MLCSLHSVTNKQQCKTLSCNESRSLQKMREKSTTKLAEKVGSHIMLLLIDTFFCNKTLKRTSGKSMICVMYTLGLVHTVVGEKAHPGTK